MVPAYVSAFIARKYPAAEVARLKADWRDVVDAGEYELIKGSLERVRDLNDPISAETRP